MNNMIPTKQSGNNIGTLKQGENMTTRAKLSHKQLTGICIDAHYHSSEE